MRASLCRACITAAALALAAQPVPAQTVQGRVVELPGEEPIAGALVALVPIVIPLMSLLRARSVVTAAL